MNFKGTTEAEIIGSISHWWFTICPISEATQINKEHKLVQDLAEARQEIERLKRCLQFKRFIE